MKNIFKSAVLAGVSLLIASSAVILKPDTAEAIPAFARKYKMSCTTCHAPYPRLKEYGDEFAGNGFVLKDQDAPRYFAKTGDENLDLIRDLPFAIRFEGFLKHQTETGKNLDLTTPYNIKLLSGGSLTKNVAYYFYFFFSERGEVAGLEDAFIMFNNLFDSELDIYVGQFQVSDPLFKRELRLTYDDYEIYGFKPGQSNINLTYDRGVMMTFATADGTDIIFEIVNGNGLAEADDFRTYDNDKYKNVAGRVSRGFGDYIRLGAFGYYGKEKGDLDRTNAVWVLAPDMTYSPNDRLELNVQYVERRDDNPSFLSPMPDDKVKTRGGFAELIYMPEGERSQWYAVGLFNYIDSDYNNQDYQTITAHIGYLLKTNIRLIAENTYDIENEENRIVLGFVAAY